MAIQDKINSGLSGLGMMAMAGQTVQNQQLQAEAEKEKAAAQIKANELAARKQEYDNLKTAEKEIENQQSLDKERQRTVKAYEKQNKVAESLEMKESELNAKYSPEEFKTNPAAIKSYQALQNARASMLTSIEEAGRRRGAYLAKQAIANRQHEMIKQDTGLDVRAMVDKANTLYSVSGESRYDFDPKEVNMMDLMDKMLGGKQ